MTYGHLLGMVRYLLMSCKKQKLLCSVRLWANGQGEVPPYHGKRPQPPLMSRSQVWQSHARSTLAQRQRDSRPGLYREHIQEQVNMCSGVWCCQGWQ